MNRFLLIPVLVLVASPAAGSPQDCRPGSVRELADAAPIIVLGEITRVSFGSSGVRANFRVYEVLKGRPEPAFTVDFGFPFLTLAPCTGPDVAEGKALLFLQRRGDVYVGIGGDDAVVAPRRPDFATMVGDVRNALRHSSASPGS